MNFKNNHLAPLAKGFLAILLGLSIAACQSKKKGEEAADSTQKNTDTAQATKPAGTKAFDINAIPLSDKPLGIFPYFNLPEGYVNFSGHKPTDFDRAYYWVGDHFEKPEGKIFYNRVTAKEGKSYSELELLRNLEDLMARIGGVKVFEGKVPADSVKAIPDDNQLKYMDGYGFISNAPTVVYLIRRADKNIWIQSTPTDDGVSACWMILESKPLKITATLIKADEIKKELDANGHIALYINFDTDKAVIQPASLPIIDELNKLLTQNSALKVKIEGHTDNAGTADHNLKLSNDRASAVKDALVKAGIKADRLQATGLGQTKPIADNATEEGKAKNRRVEVVKL